MTPLFMAGSSLHQVNGTRIKPKKVLAILPEFKEIDLHDVRYAMYVDYLSLLNNKIYIDDNNDDYRWYTVYGTRHA